VFRSTSYHKEYNAAIKRMCTGGILGGALFSDIMFLYLYLIGFFSNNCCPGEFDYLPNSVYVFMGLLFSAVVGGSLGCCFGLFSAKWNETECKNNLKK